MSSCERSGRTHDITSTRPIRGYCPQPRRRWKRRSGRSTDTRWGRDASLTAKHSGGRLEDVERLCKHQRYGRVAIACGKLALDATEKIRGLVVHLLEDACDLAGQTDRVEKGLLVDQVRHGQIHILTCVGMRVSICEGNQIIRRVSGDYSGNALLQRWLQQQDNAYVLSCPETQAAFVFCAHVKIQRRFGDLGKAFQTLLKSQAHNKIFQDGSLLKAVRAVFKPLVSSTVNGAEAPICWLKPPIVGWMTEASCSSAGPWLAIF